MEASQTIKPQELHALVEQGESVDLIDVRTPVEFRECHVDYARNVPLDRLRPEQIMADRNDSDAPLYVICQSGKRGQEACKKFHQAGFANVINVEGGTAAAVEANLPVVRGKKAISLERQVRMIAGTMCLVGVGGFFASSSPWFLVLPGMVGVGMLHAGITDSCLMGILLGGMPWNQVKEEPSMAQQGDSKPNCAC
jgi:rhodanese-related sulfurtransferase